MIERTKQRIPSCVLCIEQNNPLLPRMKRGNVCSIRGNVLGPMFNLNNRISDFHPKKRLKKDEKKVTENRFRLRICMMCFRITFLL